MQIKGRNFTIGADPEVFVAKGGRLHSAFGLVKGNKRVPYRVNKGAVQVDGMALEFNIEPADEEQDFLDNLQTVQDELKAMIEGFEFVYAPTVIFSDDIIDMMPREALDLGCEPDFNGYDLSINKKPVPIRGMRTAGGHVHIGGINTDDPHSEHHMTLSGKLARIMDEEVGVYSILWDKDDQRRSLYGKAGCFRPKYYGMEYRTMSNRWVFNKALASFVFQGTRRAIEKMFNPKYEPNPDIQHIINNSDRGHSFFKGNELAEYVQAVA